MRSAIYRGWIRHRRYAPIGNSFRYGAFLLYLDLEELDEVFAGRWLWSARRPAVAWFRRRDHVGAPERPLRETLGDLVASETGRRPSGPIRLLTHLRHFGYCFNPVSFYYCFDGEERLETIVAEITNTPWHERHCYVLPVTRSSGGKRSLRFRFPKTFHVSPFLPMDMEYDWRFTTPGENLLVHMENHRHGERVLDATMLLERRPVTTAELAKALVRHPLMTVEVIAAIHWQALRLWWKRCPHYPHPRDLARTGSRT